MASSDRTRAVLLIAGGGPAGLMLGYLLARAGVHVSCSRSTPTSCAISAATRSIPRRSRSCTSSACSIASSSCRIRRSSGSAAASATYARHHRRLHAPARARALHRHDAAMGLPQFPRRGGEALPRLPSRLKRRGDRSHRGGREGRRGCKAKTPEGPNEIRADLVVGADGRSSVLRERAGLEIEDLGAPMDALWFRLPVEQPATPAETMGRFGAGLHPGACSIAATTGSAPMSSPRARSRSSRPRGLDAFRDAVAAASPFERRAHRRDQVVGRRQASHRARRPADAMVQAGLALHRRRGACHVARSAASASTSPSQDAVAAANILAEPLLAKVASTSADLRAVQTPAQPSRRASRRRIQVGDAEQHHRPDACSCVEQPKPPLALRAHAAVPDSLQRIPARVFGLGVRREHVSPTSSARRARKPGGRDRRRRLTAALLRLRLVPERVHLGEVRLRWARALGREPLLDVAEAADELLVGRAQRRLGIELQVARDVGDDEQEIAKLLLDLRARRRVASASARADRRGARSPRARRSPRGAWRTPARATASRSRPWPLCSAT